MSDLSAWVFKLKDSVVQSLLELMGEAHEHISAATNLAALDQVRVRYLGKTGLITEQLKQLGQLPAEERKAAGQEINNAKQALTLAIDSRRESLQAEALNARLESQAVDVTLPGRRMDQGGLHPLTMTIQRIEEIFAQLGFAVAQGVSTSQATYFASFTILNMLAGYIIGIICIPRFIKQNVALKFSAIAGVAFALVALFTNGIVSVVFISLLGLANSLIWPSIWPLAIDGLGRFTKTGSSLLIMAVGGGAIIPLLYGRIAEDINPHVAYWIVVPCYFFILYYATSAYKIRTT